jgi:hypothetical protein
VVEEPGFVHHHLSTADIAEIPDGATAVVRIVEGDGLVVPYASMIDNASAQALFIGGQPVMAHGMAARTMLSNVVAAGRMDR